MGSAEADPTSLILKAFFLEQGSMSAVNTRRDGRGHEEKEGRS